MLQPLRRSRSTPRYYFAVTGDPFPPDPDGVLLAGPDAARAAALRLMGGYWWTPTIACGGTPARGAA